MNTITKEVTVASVKIEWILDTDSDYITDCGPYPIFKPCTDRHSRMANEVDIEATIDEYEKDLLAYVKDGKIDSVKINLAARQNTARHRERLRRYHAEDWCYVGCVATADDQDGNEVASASLWGIESDSDESYAADTEKDLLHELCSNLAQMGLETNIDELQSLAGEPDGFRPREGCASDVVPIPELPEVEGYTASYVYSGDDSDVSVTMACGECEAEFEEYNGDERTLGDSHYSYCSKRPQDRG